jgi:hypothetical protein
LTLETYDDPSDLYLATGDDVNAFRPMFTGDIFSDVVVPGTNEAGLAIIIAHPCSFRVGGGRMAEQVLMAVVRSRDERTPPSAWTRGLYSTMPLPDLLGDRLHVAHLDEVGRVNIADLSLDRRIACLSVLGINLLQHRLVWHMTRCAIETFKFHDAFAHTYEEADLLEEWNETLSDAQISLDQAAARFEEFLRSPQQTGTDLQTQLKDPQRRSGVRTACRAEARRIVIGEPVVAESEAWPHS